MNNGGLYELFIEVLDELSFAASEGWNMEKEWVRDMLPLRLNMMICNDMTIDEYVLFPPESLVE